jgi:serine protease Do
MVKNQYKLICCVLLLSFSQFMFAKQVNLPDFTSLVEETGAAVVNIIARKNSKQTLNQQQPQSVSPFERYFGIPQNPQNQQDRDSVAGGSGFIISSDGYIITNRHVIHDADEITVRLVDRSEYKAELIGEDEASDIALLKVEAKNLPLLKIGDTNKIKIGEWVMAIGSPLSFEHSVTKGIVSAKGRTVGRQQYVPYIQTDVPINRGNSGGPLINMNAEVIGINTLILSNTGGYMGLSFSIPIDVAMNVVEQLKNGGVVKRGLLGVVIQPVSQKLANVLGLEKPQGALVTSVNKGSAAAIAGIQEQDVIIKFNDSTVDTMSSLPPLVGSVKPGSKVELLVVRDGEAQIINAVLGGLDSDEVGEVDSSANSRLGLGFEVTGLSDSVKESLGVEFGVMVESINDRNIQRAGLEKGDVILKISKTPIKTIKQFKREINKLQEDEPLVLLVKQAGVNRYLVIERS